jgi:hypothetical protein
VSSTPEVLALALAQDAVRAEATRSPDDRSPATRRGQTRGALALALAPRTVMCGDAEADTEEEG